MTKQDFSVLDLFRLEGDVGMVTGAGAGIGRIAALSLAQAGARVAVTDIDGAAAGRVADEIKAIGIEAAAWTLDVTDESAIIRIVGEIGEAFDHIDILVNNAGTALREPTESLSTEAWDRVMATNSTAAFVCAREVGRGMLRRKRGRIINIASIMGLVGGGLYPNLAYHTSKGAIVNMTRALAAEWANCGICVNAIAPTYVNTDLTARLRTDPEMVNLIADRTPIGRFAEPEEMAGGILYLASEASSMVTGHILAIDGGWLAI